ncbi:MAG TPA: DUF4235 domain-containing protein [Trebonia sp.]
MGKKDSGSGGNGKGSGGKLAGTIATAGAVFVARKLATAAWTRATGKVPPTDPADPAVRLGEAAAWAVVVGITVEMARLFASRATARRLNSPPAAQDAVESR